MQFAHSHFPAETHHQNRVSLCLGCPASVIKINPPLGHGTTKASVRVNERERERERERAWERKEGREIYRAKLAWNKSTARRELGFWHRRRCRESSFDPRFERPRLGREGVKRPPAGFGAEKGGTIPQENGADVAKIRRLRAVGTIVLVRAAWRPVKKGI